MAGRQTPGVLPECRAPPPPQPQPGLDSSQVVAVMVYHGVGWGSRGCGEETAAPPRHKPQRRARGLAVTPVAHASPMLTL